MLLVYVMLQVGEFSAESICKITSKLSQIYLDGLGWFWIMKQTRFDKKPSKDWMESDEKDLE